MTSRGRHFWGKGKYYSQTFPPPAPISLTNTIIVTFGGRPFQARTERRFVKSNFRFSRCHFGYERPNAHVVGSTPTVVGGRLISGLKTTDVLHGLRSPPGRFPEKYRFYLIFLRVATEIFYINITTNIGPPHPPHPTRHANIAVSREAIAISDTFRCPGRRGYIARNSTTTFRGVRPARRASHVEFAFTLLKRRRGKVCALIYYITLYTRENGRGGGGDRISGIRPQNITFGGEDGSFNLKQVNDIDGVKRRRFFTFTAESPKGWEFRISS